MHTCILFYRSCNFTALLAAALLTACGIDKNGDDASPAMGDVDTDATISTTGQPLDADANTEMHVQTRAEGDRVPGQDIRLTVSGDTDAAWSVDWAQTGGPAVALEPIDGLAKRFRVPPISHDTTFSFRLDIINGEGEKHHRHVHVDVKALNWKHLAVKEPRIAGDFVAFRANKDNSLRVDLYRADLNGANILRLNGPLDPGGNVHSFSISPDGQKVAYLADEDTSGVFELYIIDAAGGDSLRVSGDLGAGASVTPDFQWSPDSRRVAYRADAARDEVFELYAAHADGSPPLRLSGEMTPDGDVAEANFLWSDDGTHIAYRANQFNDNTLELFVSASDGSGNTRLSAPPVVNGGVLGNFAWMPGGPQLAYIADQRTEDLYELFVVNHDGSGNTRVSGLLTSGGGVLDFQWSPAGDVIAYRAEQLTDGLIELYSVKADATDNTLVSALPASGDVSRFQWNDDGSSIAYLADQDSDDVFELYVAGADGLANRRVSTPLSGAGDVLDFGWSPDGDSLAYRAVQDGADQDELYTAVPDGSVTVKVSGPLDFGGDVLWDWRWSPDSNWLVYRADQRGNGTFELFSSSPDGAFNLLISGSLIGGGNVFSPEGDAFQISADSMRVVYSADQQDDETYELYVTSPDSGVAIASISGELTNGGDVRNFALSSSPAALAQLSGVQTNLPQDALLGWEQCFSNLYADNGIDSVAGVLAACNGENLMMACREVGSTLLAVAAWGPRAAVTADTGRGNVTNRANEVEWYFNDSWSWGFAAGGDAVNRNSCDVGNNRPGQRLCWHTSGGFLSGGYRCGANTGLNSSTGWERVMYHRNP